MSLSLTVKTLDSRNHKFEELDEGMTVKDFKLHIATTVGIVPESQRLIYCGRVLQDDKKLSEYGVDQKVVHLVQRQPPSSGTDRLAASEARARSRGSSPIPRSTNQARAHHIHLHGSPVNVGQPSMLVRLILAREMIARANAILDALENLTPGDTATGTTAENGSSGSSTASASPSNENAEPSGPTAPFRINMEDNSGIPASLSQVVQSALNSAMSSMVNGGSPGFQALSFRVGPNGQLTPTSSGSAVSSSSNGSRPTPGEAAAAAVAAEANNSATGSPSRTVNHPRPPALADVMRSYSELSRRINPFWEEVMTLLNDDQNQAQNAERNQNLFSRVTEAMHFMSHALHALSDGVINYNQAPPREVRARPFLIQSMVQSAVVQGLPIQVAQRTAATMPAASQPTPATSASPASTSPATPTPAQSPPEIQIRMSERQHPEVHVHMAQQQQPEMHVRMAQQPEIEVTMEPIVVGIEMGPEITINASGGGTVTRGGNITENYLQHMLEGVLNNLMGGGAPMAATSTQSTSSTSTPSTNASTNPSQDSRARGNTQTQPTTSTRTRTTTHVHYGSLGQIPIAAMGPPANSAGNAFDPFLPCHSHHIQTDRGRGARPVQRMMRQQQRSSSVPPFIDPETNGGPSRVQPSASSARTTPMQSPARRLTATIDVNLIPVFSPQVRQLQQQQRPQQLLEPGLLNMLSQLSGDMGASRDPGMLNVMQNILGQVSSVLAGEFTGRPSEGGQTVAQFLRGLPDYNYVEGESLSTDLLMTLARVLTFRDVISMVMENSVSFARLQTPLKEFLRTRIMTGDIPLEAALMKLIDDNFSSIEEVVRVANVKDDVDLAETLHKFFEDRLLTLCHCILDCPEEQFPIQFQSLIRNFLSDLTNLCLACCTDGPASLERMVKNLLESISGDVASAIQEWTMSSALGHVRNFIANHGREEDIGRLQHYIIERGSAENLQRKQARQSRNSNSTKDSSETSQNSQDDLDTFVTPRSSPERMEADVLQEVLQDEDMAMASAPVLSIPPPVIVAELPFPSELLPRGSMGPDMVVGGEPWHRGLPSDWVPIIARDIQRQAEEGQQAPFSDAYLTTQPSKRRRIIASEKPEGSVDRVIADTLQDAISASGVEPTTTVEQVLKDASTSVSVVNAVKSETRKLAKNRLERDPDFKQIGDKFPHTTSFARK